MTRAFEVGVGEGAEDAFMALSPEEMDAVIGAVLSVTYAPIAADCAGELELPRFRIGYAVNVAKRQITVVRIDRRSPER